MYENARRAYRELNEAQAQIIQNEKMAVVGTFASGLAHEVRNPLNSIALQLSILKRRVAPLPEGLAGEIKELASVIKADYAKWMLEDPRVNFAISESSARRGINHVGVQAETLEELEAVRDRLRAAEETTLDQEDAKCCYAVSSKSWVRDPDDVAWEAFVTHDQIDTFGEDRGPERIAGASRSRCCG